MTAHTNITVRPNNSKYIPLLRGVLVLLFTFGIGFLIVGCSSGQESGNNIDQEMVDYYSDDSVKAYYRDLKGVIDDTAIALKENDTSLMNSALTKLDSLCGAFKKAQNVPDSFLQYHEKMLEVAGYLEDYSADIKADDMEKAAQDINSASVALSEAKGFLPESSSGS